MTNAEIITREAERLMNAGIIGTTGRTFRAVVIDKDGNEQEKDIPEPEPIHTYNGWKERGYQVKRGSKAIAKFAIWKQVVKKAKKEDEKDTPLMIMKTAAWFSLSQVEPVQ